MTAVNVTADEGNDDLVREADFRRVKHMLSLCVP